MALNDEQQAALDSILAGDNVFVSGGAGVGKSHLVNHIREHVHNLAVTAMTGCEVSVQTCFAPTQFLPPADAPPCSSAGRRSIPTLP